MRAKTIIQYNGEKFRRYLERHNLSYQDAAEMFDVDKNTIGKVVRDKNVTMKVLLKIVNNCDFPIGHFFTSEVVEEEEDSTDNNRMKDRIGGPNPNFGFTAEQVGDYKNCEKQIRSLIEIIQAKDAENKSLQDTNHALREQVALLQRNFLELSAGK